MALQEANQIIEAIKFAIQERRAREMDEVERKRIEADIEQRKIENERRLKEFDEQKRQFDISAKAAEAVRQAALAEARMKIGKEAAESGILPPGSEPYAQTPNGAGFSPINPAQASGHILNFPDGTRMAVPTPAIYAKQQADVERITQRPKVEADIEKARSLQADLLKKQEEAKDADLFRAMVQKQYEDQREEKRIKAENYRAELRAATDIKVANINKRGAVTEDVSPYINQLRTGTLSREEFMRMPLSNTDKMTAINSVTKSGDGIINNKQKEFIQDLTTLVEAVDAMDEVIKKGPQTGNILSGKIGGVLSTLNEEVRTPEKILEGRSSLIMKHFGEKGTLTNADVYRSKEGFIPSRSEPVKMRVAKRNQYVNDLKKLIRNKLRGLSDNQINLIMEDIGVNDIPDFAGIEGKKKAPAGADKFSKYYEGGK